MTYARAPWAAVLWITIAVVHAPTGLSCTSTDPESSTLLLGQQPPGREAVKFLPELISADKHPHGSLTFTPDGNAAYWSAFLDEGPEQTIYFAEFDGRRVTAPRPASFAVAVESYGNGGPAFSKDGGKLFFNSYRTGSNEAKGALPGIWYVELTETGWINPRPLACTIDSTRSTGQVSVALSGNIYFAGRQSGERQPKLYCCLLVDGEYYAPELLTGDINAFDAVDPYVDPGEKFILFASRSQRECLGITDLYISYRELDGTWGKPVSLGGRVNTAYFERFPSMSPDGRYLCFVRCVGNQYPSDDTHFYWLDAGFLDSLS
ncbi:MAG: hypothetical protein GY867_08590, partial [bacterium]|nr:hypothetical protein [bacterium]